MAHKQTINPDKLLSLKAIADDPEKLRSLNRSELRAHWQAHFPKDSLPPTPALLLHELAFKSQAHFYGGLDKETQRLIKQLCRTASREEGKGAVIKLHRSTASKLKNGTRLIRHWQGVDHEVIYEDKQFLYQGKRYQSLTKIAELITGAHWSGPRFFGVNKLQGTS